MESKKLKIEKGNFEIWIENGTFKILQVLYGLKTNYSLENFYDANKDGYLDILKPFHYGSLYRTNPVWWDVYASKGIKLNHLIWLNNGNGTFSYTQKRI